MPKMHLGVLDIPYTVNAETTGDVAEFLEAKYHVMGTFFEAHEAEVIEALTQSIGDAFQDVLSGAPSRANPFADAENEIQAMFVKFIDRREMDGVVPGVPTKASLAGVNSRMKGGRQSGSRPSFRDTGTYENSFRVWVEE